MAGRPGGGCWWWLLVLAAACLLQRAQVRKALRCPGACSCTKDSIICVGSASVPRIGPGDISSLSLVNGTFSEIRERMFSHLPSLQLL
uniref:Leucine-rich repeat LGI member 2 n=2 Tax=Sphaerodactylus townsendi TaxID=933632 RepID=A0ACB8E763_9SAUR